MKKTDLTAYPIKSQISFLKLIPKIQKNMVEANNWEELKKSILSLVVVSAETLEHFENKYKTN